MYNLMIYYAFIIKVLNKSETCEKTSTHVIIKYYYQRKLDLTEEVIVNSSSRETLIFNVSYCSIKVVSNKRYLWVMRNKKTQKFSFFILYL